MQTRHNPQTDADADAADAADGRWAMVALAAAMLLASLGISIVNVALPALSAAFGIALPALQWAVLAYLLAVTIASPAAGQLGDRFGARNTLVVALLLFAAASALGAFAPGFAVLVAARTGQGLAAACLLALTMALVRGSVPPARTGRAMGVLATMSAVGTALGPSLGGVLLAVAGWRALFAILVPLSLAAAAIAARHLPHRPASGALTAQAGFAAGACLTVALGAYAAAMTRGGTIDSTSVFLFVAAAGAFALFWYIRRRTAAAGPPLGTTSALAANALVSAVMMTTLVVGPFYLTGALHLGDAATGLVMATGPVLAALSGTPAGRLTDRFGTFAIAIAGLGLMAVAALGLAVLPGLFGVAGYIGALVCLTPGYQLFQAANNTAVMIDAAADRRSAAAARLSLSRNLGFITGASLMGAVFARAAGTPDVSGASSSAIGTGLAVTFGLAVGMILLALALVIASRSARNEGRVHG